VAFAALGYFRPRQTPQLLTAQGAAQLLRAETDIVRSAVSTTPMILETAGSIGLPSPMFVPASQGSHIRAMLAAKETGRPRTAAASRAFTNGLKHC
jgi:hypothetical protein